ncbi:MAG: rane protein [Ignavibacteria bacterium]|nr:rane protein [Ignavibacteria bacterium]
MKFRGILIVPVFIGLLACSAQSKEKVTLKTLEDSVSYSIGMSIGTNLKTDSVMLNLDAVKAGMRDALYDTVTVLTKDQMMKVLQSWQTEMQKKQMEKRMKASEGNKKIGEDYLTENKKKSGVVTLPSGLQYKVVKSGSGKTPGATSSVKVHYKGTLINGKVFDSSEGKEPLDLTVNGVIKGWTEALQLMKEGDKWTLYIPSELGYVDRGAGADIGPNEALIFDVELIKVNESAPEPPPEANPHK